jgi:hypothetical protein
VESGEKARALLAREIPDRRAEEREQPPPSLGQPHEMMLEVADDAVHLDLGVLLGDRRRCLAERLLGHVEWDESPEVPGLDHCV